MVTYSKLENAVFNGSNLIGKKKHKREWKNVLATGIVKKNILDKTLVEVIDPNVKTEYKFRQIDMSSFDGTIKFAGGTKQIWKKGTKETIKNTIKEYKEVIKTFFGNNTKLEGWTINNLKELAELIKKDNKPVKKRVTVKRNKKGILV